MRRNVLWSMVCAMIVLAACSGRASRPADDERAAAPPPAEEAKRVPPPANSPLSKVKEGMGMKEVSDILGQPTDQGSYVTGKAFIPFYYGDDMARIEWRYKGMGRVIFTGGGPYGQQGGKVQWVEYDPAESGYRR